MFFLFIYTLSQYLRDRSDRPLKNILVWWLRSEIKSTSSDFQMSAVEEARVEKVTTLGIMCRGHCNA